MIFYILYTAQTCMQFLFQMYYKLLFEIIYHLIVMKKGKRDKEYQVYFLLQNCIIIGRTCEYKKGNWDGVKERRRNVNSCRISFSLGSARFVFTLTSFFCFISNLIETKSTCRPLR